MSNLVFMIPFTIDPKETSLKVLIEELGLTRKRMDSLDSQAGYRHIGTTGAIRLFRQDNKSINKDDANYYELQGVAADQDSKNMVLYAYKSDYQKVVAKGRIDRWRLIITTPPPLPTEEGTTLPA